MGTCDRLLGIGIVRVGTQLRDPLGQYAYTVAAPCSGIHSLVATTAIALIYSLVTVRSWWKVALMLASAVPLAVAGNVLRMLSIVFAAELGGHDWGKAVHDGGPMGLWSLLPYIPVFGGLLLLGHWLRRPPASKTKEGSAPLAQPQKL